MHIFKFFVVAARRPVKSEKRANKCDEAVLMCLAFFFLEAPMILPDQSRRRGQLLLRMGLRTELPTRASLLREGAPTHQAMAAVDKRPAVLPGPRARPKPGNRRVGGLGEKNDGVSGACSGLIFFEPFWDILFSHFFNIQFTFLPFVSSAANGLGSGLVAELSKKGGNKVEKR